MLSKIRNQLVFGFLFIAAVPLLIIGVYSYASTSSSLRNSVLSKFNDIANFETKRIETFLSGVKEDVFIMRDSPTLHNMLSVSGDTYNNQRALLEKEFLAISQNKKIYYQVRYLNEKGKEVVRVDSNGTTSSIVPRNKLQNKAKRYYFKDAFILNEGEIFISPLDLNRERGKVEKPIKPVIRYGTPVFHKGKKRGIVLVNVFGSKFLDPIKLMNRKDEYNLLFSNKGHYFSHDDSAKEWGGPVDLNTKENVSKDFPARIASMLTGSDIGNIELGENIISQSMFYPDEKNIDVYWKLARISKKNIVFAPLNRFLMIFIILMVISLIIATSIALGISKKITEPIVHLTDASEAISKGKIDTPIYIYGSSEIKTLGQAVQRLKTSLEVAMKHLKK